ncbi:SURF1 family protein [Streptomyces sp. NPDC020875]|uniref:SURF1 family protein n=1 Tax=Streptomyces sp. NPDC020875 TaxID=3154898 RepID=UPI0033CF66C9
MYRFLLTPRWWGINLFAVLAIPLCIFMGTWQLGRFEDRAEAQKEAERAPTAEELKPRPLGQLLPVDKETSGRTATAEGRYGEQFLVPGRKLDDLTGSYVLTLLKTDGGRVLPVIRGWLPAGAAAPAAPTGRVSVAGALQASETVGKDGVHTAGGLPEGQLAMISAAALVNLVPDEVYDAYITLNRADAGLKAVPATLPEGTGLDLKAFQNLGYSGEWYAGVAFILFMWFRFFRREVELQKDAALGLVPETGSGPGPGTAPDAGPGTAPNAETGPDAGLDTDTDTDTDTNTDTEPKSDTKSESGRESGAEAGAGAGRASG